jgi:hypothetical protein
MPLGKLILNCQSYVSLAEDDGKKRRGEKKKLKNEYYNGQPSCT